MSEQKKEPVKFFVEIYRREDMKKLCVYTDTQHVYIYKNELGLNSHVIEIKCPISKFMQVKNADVVDGQKVKADDERMALSMLAVYYTQEGNKKYEIAIEIDKMHILSGDFIVDEDGYSVRTLYHYGEFVEDNLENMQIKKYEV